MKAMDGNRPFYFKDCALIAIATGVRAQTLVEFRDKLAAIPPACIFYHFWASHLDSAIEHYEYQNDFSKWCHLELHDDFLAERLDLLNPAEYKDVESLRADIIEIIEGRLDEVDAIPFSKRENQFHFIRSTIVVFNTSYEISEPRELLALLPQLSRSSIFYHFIDSKRRTPEAINDFSAWLRDFNGLYASLIEQLDSIDSYYLSLTDLKQKLIDLFKEYFKV